jgi:hypothetical protein
MADDENKSAEDTEPSTPGSAGEESTGKTTPDESAPKKRAAPRKRATAKKAESSRETRIEVQLSAAAEPRDSSARRPEPPKPFWWRALLMVAVVVFLFTIIRNMAGGPQSQETLLAGAGLPAIPGESGPPDSGDVVVEVAPSLPPGVSDAPSPGYYGYPYPPQHPGYPQPEWSPPTYQMAPQGGYGYGYPYPQQHPWPPPYYYWYWGPSYYSWYPPYPGEPVPDE